ncbi:hypothetical protein N9J88_02445 [Porticoccaceae bacterium]|nr:hypothetical protein [Porticoccaceae bacterium]
MTSFGVVVTFVYIVLIIVLRLSSLSDLQVMPLNEFGDFLAGVFGPLMLFWLILGYIQQQKELRQNTKALQLQADELKRSVEQYTQLVKVAGKQFEIDSELLNLQLMKGVREAHPGFFVIGAGLVGTNGVTKKFKIIIEDKGQPASSVRFHSDPCIKEIDNLTTVAFLDKGKKEELVWSDEFGIAPENLELSIRCKDANNQSFCQTFYLILRDNDQYDVADSSVVGS